MKLHDLVAGQEVVLEIIWGKTAYSVVTKVMGKNDEGVLVQPYVYRGESFNMESGDATVAFNLYHVEEKIGTRVAWKNVSLAVRKYKDNIYYAIKPDVLGNLALSSERRANVRTVVGVEGVVESGDISSLMRVGDISDVGVSFFLSGAVQLPRTDVVVSFCDVVRGHAFDVKLPCRILRSVPQPDGIVKYGCRVFNPPMEVMMYTYMKRLDQKHGAAAPAAPADAQAEKPTAAQTEKPAAAQAEKPAAAQAEKPATAPKEKPAGDA